MVEVKRLLEYLAYTALAGTLLLAAGAYAAYRSLLPRDLPARPTTTLPLVRGAVHLALQRDGKGKVARTTPAQRGMRS